MSIMRLACLIGMVLMVFSLPLAAEELKTSSLIEQEKFEMNVEMGKLQGKLLGVLGQGLPEDFIHPVLVSSDFRGYNIVKYEGVFYAIDRLEGSIDVTKLQAQAKLPWFSSSKSMEDLKVIIQQKGRPPRNLFEKVADRIVLIKKKLVGGGQ